MAPPSELTHRPQAGWTPGRAEIARRGYPRDERETRRRSPGRIRLAGAAPAAFAKRPPAPPNPTIHCSVSGGATLRIRTPTGAVSAVLPAGERLRGHGGVLGRRVFTEVLNASEAGAPSGRSLHGVLALAVDITGNGGQRLVLPAGADVDVTGVWRGAVFVIEAASLQAAPSVLPPVPSVMARVDVQQTLVIETASGQQTVVLAAGSRIGLNETPTLSLIEMASAPGAYSLKLPAGVTLRLVGIGPESGRLALPATLTLTSISGPGAVRSVSTSPLTSGATVTITAVVPTPAVASVSTVPITMPVAATTTTSPAPVVQSSGSTGSTTSGTTTPPGTTTTPGHTTTTGTTAPGTASPGTTAAPGTSRSTAPVTTTSATTSTTAPGSSVAATSGSPSTSASRLPKTGSAPLDVQLGLGLIVGGAAVVGLPWLRRRRSSKT